MLTLKMKITICGSGRNTVFVNDSFFHDGEKKSSSLYEEKKKHFIYNWQIVPINCDYEILSPLMWVVVDIWALPYWTILVPFVYFWNKMMFKIDSVVEDFFFLSK